MKSVRGFTLVEVLIAVTVFAVLAGAVYFSLNALAEAAFTQRERSADLAELQRGIARLEADLRQLASRPARGADGELLPALGGSLDRIEATRAGWANPQRQRRSELQRFAWSIDPEGLIRSSWPVTDRMPATQVVQERVLAGVEWLEFGYLDAAGQWLESWPDSAVPQGLPRAVRYRLQSPRFGTIERVIVLP